MVEITGMQHKGVNGNVHRVTRLHVTFRYQGPLLLYFTREGRFWCSLAVCRHCSDAKRWMYCAGMYNHTWQPFLSSSSFLFLQLVFVHRALGALFRREFWYIPNPDRCGVILGKPWVHDPSTFWMTTRMIPQFRLSYQRGWMLCDPAIFVWQLRIVCRLFVGWKAWKLTHELVLVRGREKNSRSTET